MSRRLHSVIGRRRDREPKSHGGEVTGVTARPVPDGVYWERADAGRPRYLIVLCHGIGANGYQLAHLVRTWADKMPDAVFAAPHAPFRHRTRRWQRWLPWAGEDGREWFRLGNETPCRQQTGIRAAAAMLDHFVDSALLHFSLAPEAYALAGFSQGAMTALFTGLRRPVAPRAIVSYAGALVGAASLPAEIRNRAPVLFVHGEADPIVDCGRSRAAARALQALDIPVASLYRPDLDHQIDGVGGRTGGDFLLQAIGQHRGSLCGWTQGSLCRKPPPNQARSGHLARESGETGVNRTHPIESRDRDDRWDDPS